MGVCSWGVDYGLVDTDGRLLEDPVCYRDARTEGAIDAVTSRVPREEIFERTGIQFLPFNTLYQLDAHCRAGLPAGTARLLLIPDLCHRARATSSEYTNASTTQMLSLSTRDWDREMVERLGLPAAMLPPLLQPGTDAGPLEPSLAAHPGLAGTRVVVPATHDTGSAVGHAARTGLGVRVVGHVVTGRRRARAGADGRAGRPCELHERGRLSAPCAS